MENIFKIELDLLKKKKPILTSKSIGKQKILLLHYDYESDQILIGKEDGDVDVFKFDDYTGVSLVTRLTFNGEGFTYMSSIGKN